MLYENVVNMSLRWDESLVLGFDEIDNQHRSIFVVNSTYQKS